MAPKAKSVLALVLAAAGIALAIVGQAVGWWIISTDVNPWTITGHEYHFEATTSFLPGADYRFWCSVNNTSMPGWGPICPATQPAGAAGPYVDPIVPQTATGALFGFLDLFMWITGLIAAGGVVAGAAHLALSARRPKTPRNFAWILLLVAGALALGAPVGVAFAQPAAYVYDHPGGASAVHSFWGSCQSSSDPSVCGINATQTWGAGPGWYLSLSAGGLFVVAGVVGKARIGGSAARQPSKSS